MLVHMPQLADWQTYFAVQAGAAATLTGLVFVAVSINLTRILSVPGLPGRAFDALLQLLQVFFIASFTLVPHQSAQALATEILVIAVFSLIAQLISQTRYARLQPDHPRSWLAIRITLSLAAALPFYFCGLLLIPGLPAAIFGLVLGCIFSFVAAVMGAWVLLIEILR
jgi:hypothetical protein